MSLNRRKLVVLVLLGAILVIAAAVHLTREPPEPEYQGRTLSSWLDEADLKYGQGADDRESVAAIRQIGTNAIPFLLRWSRLPSAWHARLMITADDRLPPTISRSRMVQCITGGEELAHRIRLAMTGFETLRDIAVPAIPDLLHDATNTANAIQESQATYAIELLGYLGSNAVPPLLTLATNSPSRSCRIAALNSLGSTHKGARSAIPALIHWTRDPDKEFAGSAIRSLGRIHEDPETVVPVLMACLGDLSWRIRWSACKALGEFGPDARPAIPLLIAHLNDPISEVACFSARALGETQQESDIIVPALVSMLQSTNQDIHGSVALALGRFRDQSRPALPELLRLLNDAPNENTRRDITKALSEIAPETLTNSVAR